MLTVLLGLFLCGQVIITSHVPDSVVDDDEVTETFKH